MGETPTFDAPGAGSWTLDRSHYPGGTTPISQWLMGGCAVGMRQAFEEFGMPADTLDVRFVHGFMYTRLRPLIAPDRPARRPPPRPVVKLAARIHRGMRRRARQAARVLEERPWRGVVEEWHAVTRPGLEARNSAWLEVDVAAFDDTALAAHISDLLAYCRSNFELHFYLHVYDLGPIGLLLADCRRWAIEPHEVIPALAGASPSTSAPAVLLSKLRSLVAAAGSRPSTLEEVRGLSREAGAVLDQYLQRRGRMMVTRYDLDGRTLEEQPEVVLAAILDGNDPAAEEQRALATASQLRQRVPAGERDIFDERLNEARATMDLRDDNGPNTVELPVGILRYALFEAGRRLAGRGLVDQAEHVFELERDEVEPMIGSGDGPTAAELGERAERRRRLAALDPPVQLGPAEPPPPLQALAPSHQVMVGAVQSVLVHLGMSATDGDDLRSPLQGVGIGDVAYRGRARVADSPEAALDAMEPGDVLVVRFTTPAYNTVLSIAGALITASGALLSHAAVMARELGIPAVVGAPGALDIPDAATVEVDPVAGIVRVLADV